MIQNHIYYVFIGTLSKNLYFWNIASTLIKNLCCYGSHASGGNQKED